MIIDPGGRWLHLLSSEGDRKTAAGKECKKLDAAEKRALRSFVFTLG